MELKTVINIHTMLFFSVMHLYIRIEPRNAYIQWRLTLQLTSEKRRIRKGEKESFTLSKIHRGLVSENRKLEKRKLMMMMMNIKSFKESWQDSKIIEKQIKNSPQIKKKMKMWNLTHWSIEVSTSLWEQASAESPWKKRWRREEGLVRVSMNTEEYIWVQERE